MKVRGIRTQESPDYWLMMQLLKNEKGKKLPEGILEVIAKLFNVSYKVVCRDYRDDSLIVPKSPDPQEFSESDIERVEQELDQLLEDLEKTTTPASQ